jgi:isopentenyl diphosphate isomerase/L-lactate dehydrogenase-like FMN-dependent dehydrogenase
VICVSTASSGAHDEIAQAAADAPRWLQLYVLNDKQRTLEHVAEARKSGYRALVLTVDTPYLGRRERDLRFGFEIPPDLPLPYFKGNDPSIEMTFAEQQLHMSPSLSWRDLEWIASESGMPVILKGILTREDATLAVEHGAAGIIVSNHGGRQLDGAPATLDALPEVVEAAAGRCEVYIDGGIRRGTDVLKALALGARAALVGRAIACGLAVGGEAGVRDVLSLLRDEIELGLALLGCNSPAEVTRSHVEPTRPYDPAA